MSEANDLDRRLASLERTVQRQRAALGALALLSVVIGLASWTSGDPEVVRAQRFLAVDDQGREVGVFGFSRTGEVSGIGWNLDDPDTDASAFCYVGRDPEEGTAKDQGIAGLQLEAGWAISQQFVRELTKTVTHSYVIGEDEKTAVRLTADETSAEFFLSPIPHGGSALLPADGRGGGRKNLVLRVW